jgi:hypothetical protein
MNAPAHIIHGHYDIQDYRMHGNEVFLFFYSIQEHAELSGGANFITTQAHMDNLVSLEGQKGVIRQTNFRHCHHTISTVVYTLIVIIGYVQGALVFCW